MSSSGGERNILKINDATVYRSRKKVLDSFSLSIERGEHTAIIGANGSGKSTLIQLLTHQLYPVVHKDDTPVVTVFGKSQWILSELRHRLGIISADFQNEVRRNLKGGHLSGKDVVITGFFSSLQLFAHQKISEEMQSQAHKALSLMDAEYLAEKMFDEMSAGESRRVLIARAMVTSPEVLVLDEPTTALDFVARHHCMSLIRRLARNGTTIIIVTHHLEEVIPEIKNIILLKEGEVVFAGSKQKVLTSENLSIAFDYPLTLHKKRENYRLELDRHANQQH